MICSDCLEILISEKSKTTINVLTTLLFDSVQIFLLCFYGTKLANVGMKVAEAAYDSGWHEMKEKKVRTAVELIILRSQKPSFLTAGKFVKISLENFQTVS
jgi:hypothetical protein